MVDVDPTRLVAHPPAWLYVGMSRARTYLAMVMEGPARGDGPL